MISKVKSAVANFMGGSGTSSCQNHACVSRSGVPPRPGAEVIPVKFPFERPSFLELTPEELRRSADHIQRPVLTPPERLLWSTGYAEVINSGKSQNNEDQACCEVVNVERRSGNSRRNSLSSTDDEEGVCNTHTSENKEKDRICFHYWGLFDGHAGPGAAIMASKLLHLQICEQLRDISDILQNASMPPPICLNSELKTQSVEQVEDTPTEENRVFTNESTCRFHQEKKVSHQSLVVGAIENAFKQMDEHIERERSKYSILGGCCAMAVVYLLGKLYVANAGDSRAIIIRNGKILPMSREFTPETERQRIQFVGFMKPELLGNEFTYLEFPRRIQYKELGKRMLFRDHTMTGCINLLNWKGVKGHLLHYCTAEVTPKPKTWKDMQIKQRKSFRGLQGSQAVPCEPCKPSKIAGKPSASSPAHKHILAKNSREAPPLWCTLLTIVSHIRRLLLKHRRMGSH
ncbi:protein phosphatase 1H-like isoform X2 [Lissotriton helveticus]